MVSANSCTCASEAHTPAPHVRTNYSFPSFFSSRSRYLSKMRNMFYLSSKIDTASREALERERMIESHDTPYSGKELRILR